MEQINGYRQLKKYLIESTASKRHNIEWAYGVLERAKNILNQWQYSDIENALDKMKEYWEEMDFYNLIAYSWPEHSHLKYLGNKTNE